MIRPLIFATIALILSLGPFSAPAMAQDAHSSFIDVPDAKLWVTDTGGKGEPVFLLHAHTGTSESFANQIPALAQAGFRVIAFDRPGWGKSVARAGAKPQSGAEDLDALADALELKTFHIVGVAHGGYIAVDYAAWKPDRVKSMVVAASGLGIEINNADVEALRKRTGPPGFAQWPPEMRELGASYRAANPDGAARWKGIEEHAMQKGAPDPAMRTPNTDAKVASLATPVLVIAGDEDLTTPSAAIRLWAGHLKIYDWLLMPKAGHAPNWEQPAAFNAAVIAFLRKH